MTTIITILMECWLASEVAETVWDSLCQVAAKQIRFASMQLVYVDCACIFDKQHVVQQTSPHSVGLPVCDLPSVESPGNPCTATETAGMQIWQ